MRFLPPLALILALVGFIKAVPITTDGPWEVVPIVMPGGIEIHTCVVKHNDVDMCTLTVVTGSAWALPGGHFNSAIWLYDNECNLLQKEPSWYISDVTIKDKFSLKLPEPKAWVDLRFREGVAFNDISTPADQVPIPGIVQINYGSNRQKDPKFPPEEDPFKNKAYSAPYIMRDVKGGNGSAWYVLRMLFSCLP